MFYILNLSTHQQTLTIYLSCRLHSDSQALSNVYSISNPELSACLAFTISISLHHHQFSSVAMASISRSDRIFIILRAVQLFSAMAYLICIAVATENLGQWSYASIKPAVGLGSKFLSVSLVVRMWLISSLPVTGAVLTCLAAAIYAIMYPVILHPPTFHGPFRSLVHLLLRVFVDFIIALLWLSTFLVSHLPKETNLDNLFALPPVKIWTASVVIALIESYVILTLPGKPLLTEETCYLR